MCRLRSGAPSFHQTGPRSPSKRFATSTASWAAASPAWSCRPFASLTDRRADMSSETSAAFRSIDSRGFARRHSRPRTTKYRPSGVTGCCKFIDLPGFDPLPATADRQISGQPAAFLLTPFRSAMVFSFVFAAFSSLRFVVSNRTTSSCPSSSAHAISVPYRAIS